MSEVAKAALAVWFMLFGMVTVGMAEMEFPWEALATLVAGTGAVIAAIIIGMRQTAIAFSQNKILDRQARIAERQADILEKQVDLERLTLRGDLFDRRFAVFVSAEAWMNHVLQGEEINGAEIMDRFKTALDQARFLFGKEANERLSELAIRSIQYYGKLKASKRMPVDGGQIQPERVADLQSLETWLRARKHNLSDVFGPELAVSDSPFVFKANLETTNMHWAPPLTNP